MVLEFKFPDVGEGIHEGTIVKWRVKENDNVESDQILADVETDKAVVEIPSPRKGTILKLYHKEGEVIKVGETLAVIGEKGEKVPRYDAFTGSKISFIIKPALTNKTTSSRFPCLAAIYKAFPPFLSGSKRNETFIFIRIFAASK